MGKVQEMNNKIINDLRKENAQLKDELLQWETGQKQTERHYNAYRQRGIELFEKDKRIEELKTEKKEAYHQGYKQGKADQHFDFMNQEHD